MSIIAMIPARMGSQRLKQKNLRELDGIPLITRAIRKCKKANVFDEIWVNSENEFFGEIAKQEGVNFHLRPEHLGNNTATSEQFVAEFLEKHNCTYLVQVHSIAPLLTVAEVKGFVEELQTNKYDCLLSAELIQIECAINNQPINFTFTQKTNSQELTPVQRISWSITAWRRDTYLQAIAKGQCATYAGNIGFYTINHLASHIIKTEEDLQIAEILLPLVNN